MSAVAVSPQAVNELDAKDAYYYGYRDEPELQPDGAIRMRRIALTARDHLHPQEGDRFVEDSLHDFLRSHLRDNFRLPLRHDPTALVLSNTPIYWDADDLQHHAPDVAVIFGVRQQQPLWSSFSVREQAARPRLIVELVSPRYRDNDAVHKLAEYHQARVPIYVILDREREDDPWSIQAYQRRPRRYVPLPLEEDGRLWLEDLNLWLSAEGQRVRCFDGDSNEELGDLEAVTRKAAQEKARADAAEARLHELQAELARLKTPPPAP
jgi:hypothetical protein